MAESSLQDVALNTQSAGDHSPSDAPATTTDNNHIGGDAEEGVLGNENGHFLHDHVSTKMDEQLFEDGTARSDTDTSRANSVTGDGKPNDAKPVKKFIASKPMSFAKYSVPKAVAANAPPKVSTEKAPTPVMASTLSLSLGRPRLVAKSTSSSQQKLSSYKPTAPDPMQVWNKNRATPQQSTKHLTDEELKQQYGIHLTSRIQSDGDGKEAKWADIDDDEDDWAPETIEWNDGTKTTVNPADTLSLKQNAVADGSGLDPARLSTVPKPAGHQYSSSVGPNATVLKIGANVERQQAQKALAQQSRGSSDKQSVPAPKASPAPAPMKSPWAKLPEIDKISPIAIVPQPVPVHNRFPPLAPQTSVSNAQASSPAKEISADDFNRSWRQSPSSQTKELFMPSSGRYEAVADGKRRMSRNEQNFRAPAVLQRPNQRDSRAPAEPSAAFQTHRTSMDQGRRRASSTISGSDVQFVRSMSFKSVDTNPLSQSDATAPRPLSRDGLSPQPQTPSQQAASAEGTYSAPQDGGTEVDLEAQKLAQKLLMKEKREQARQRKVEEEQRLEAEKQERIRLKLLSLGPLPEPAKPQPEESTANKPTETKTSQPTTFAAAAPIQSPPKPPQPNAGDEPQQYGMMTVHPVDSVKKQALSPAQPADAAKMSTELSAVTSASSTMEKTRLPSPVVNGVRPVSDAPKSTADDVNISEPSPKLSKSMPAISNDARAGWSLGRPDHRAQQTSNLWALPNKALGNGTFDSSLAGYSPQDLSRASSTGQGWMNGRTPIPGQSPQLSHANQHVPETRSYLLQSMTSPDSQPLSLNSEVDSALPTSRPAPIGRPQVQAAQMNANRYAGTPQSNLAAWGNFHNVARVQEKAETEKFNRDLIERKEEEKRTGVQQQAPYSFNETFKQVQLGEQASQRNVSNVVQTSQSPSDAFGAVRPLPAGDPTVRLVNGPLGRGSRFFPQQANGGIHAERPERRAVTYSHPEVPGSPSPPPAEEIASAHPAFDGGYERPKVHFPREKAVVRLPPATPPAPQVPVKEPAPTPQPQPQTPLTWAARVSMAPPAPAPAPSPQRAVSTPIVNNPSWQERFNGLLFPKQPIIPRTQPAPALASTREPLEIISNALPASVSLPFLEQDVSLDAGVPESKAVEDEEDLFEDREAGSLPTVHLPRDVPPPRYPPVISSRLMPAPVDPNSIHMFMVSNWSEKYGYAKPQYAVIKAPGNTKGIKRDLPVKVANGTTQARPRTIYPTKHHSRPKPNLKPRVVSKAH